MSTVTTARARGSFFLQEDGADLLKELGVDILSLGGLVASGDSLVAAAAAAADSTVEATAAAAGGTVVVVARGGFSAGTRHQREGYALWKNNFVSLQSKFYLVKIVLTIL